MARLLEGELAAGFGESSVSRSVGRGETTTGFDQEQLCRFRFSGRRPPGSEMEPTYDLSRNKFPFSSKADQQHVNTKAESRKPKAGCSVVENEKDESVAVVESSSRKRRDVLGATLRRLRSDPSHPFPIVKH